MNYYDRDKSDSAINFFIGVIGGIIILLILIINKNGN